MKYNIDVKSWILIPTVGFLCACNPTGDSGGGSSNGGNEPSVFLNDTGVTRCQDYLVSNDHDYGEIICFTAGASESADGTDAEGDIVPGGQDAVYGRDSAAFKGTLMKVGHGSGGFDFSKVDAEGNVIPVTSEDWDCVLDNHTGLMWEVKTTVDGLSKNTNSVTWYNSDPSTNGGYVGTETQGSCLGILSCDTEKYVAAINEAGLCSYSDWRLPTRAELLGVVDYSSSTHAMIDQDYFSNTLSEAYWASETGANLIDRAWIVNFNYGNSSLTQKSQSGRILLVRKDFQ